MRLAHKVEKVQQEEFGKNEEATQEWMQTEEYKQLQEKLAKAVDEDEYKNDDDPRGFKIYKTMVSKCKSES